eukprot:Nk52_evm4s526 gene=Nk52_evmTU4s526
MCVPKRNLLVGLFFLIVLIIWLPPGGRLPSVQGSTFPALTAPLQVAFIFQGDGASDLGWENAHSTSRAKLAGSLASMTVHPKVIPGQGFSSLVDTLVQTKNTRLFVAASGDFQFDVKAAAEKYPDRFFTCPGFLSGTNYIVLQVRRWEAHFYNGLVAGWATKTGRVGMVLGIPFQTTKTEAYAFQLGVKEIRPDAKVFVYEIGTFLDGERDRAAALDLIKTHQCDVITSASNSLDPQQVASENGVFSTAFYTDKRQFVGDSLLTSTIVDWTPLFTKLITDTLAGNFPSNANPFELGVETNSAFLSDLSPSLNATVVASVNSYKALANKNPFCGQRVGLATASDCITDVSTLIPSGGFNAIPGMDFVQVYTSPISGALIELSAATAGHATMFVIRFSSKALWSTSSSLELKVPSHILIPEFQLVEDNNIPKVSLDTFGGNYLWKVTRAPFGDERYASVVVNRTGDGPEITGDQLVALRIAYIFRNPLISGPFPAIDIFLRNSNGILFSSSSAFQAPITIRASSRVKVDVRSSRPYPDRKGMYIVDLTIPDTGPLVISNKQIDPMTEGVMSSSSSTVTEFYANLTAWADFPPDYSVGSMPQVEAVDWILVNNTVINSTVRSTESIIIEGSSKIETVHAGGGVGGTNVSQSQVSHQRAKMITFFQGVTRTATYLRVSFVVSFKMDFSVPLTQSQSDASVVDAWYATIKKMSISICCARSPPLQTYSVDLSSANVNSEQAPVRNRWISVGIEPATQSSAKTAGKQSSGGNVFLSTNVTNAIPIDVGASLGTYCVDEMERDLTFLVNPIAAWNYSSGGVMVLVLMLLGLVILLGLIVARANGEVKENDDVEQEQVEGNANEGADLKDNAIVIETLDGEKDAYDNSELKQSLQGSSEAHSNAIAGEEVAPPEQLRVSVSSHSNPGEAPRQSVISAVLTRMKSGTSDVLASPRQSVAKNGPKDTPEVDAVGNMANEHTNRKMRNGSVISNRSATEGIISWCQRHHSLVVPSSYHDASENCGSGTSLSKGGRYIGDGKLSQNSQVSSSSVGSDRRKTLQGMTQIHPNVENIVRLISVFAKFFQLTVIIISVKTPWLSERGSVLDIISLVSFDFEVYFWLIVAGVIIWLGYLLVVNTALEEQWSEHFIGKIVLYPADILLPLVPTAMFIPIMVTLFYSLKCVRNLEISVREDQTPNLYLYEACDMLCWEGQHWAYGLIGCLLIVIFFPLSCFSQIIWQEIEEETDIRYSESFLVFQQSWEIILVLIKVFIPGFQWLYISVVLFILTLFFLAFTLSDPCSVPWVNRLHQLVYAVCLMEAIVVMLSFELSDANSIWPPVTLALVCVLSFIIYFISYDHVHFPDKFISPGTSKRMKIRQYMHQHFGMHGIDGTQNASHSVTDGLGGMGVHIDSSAESSLSMQTMEWFAIENLVDAWISEGLILSEMKESLKMMVVSRSFLLSYLYAHDKSGDEKMEMLQSILSLGNALQARRDMKKKNRKGRHLIKRMRPNRHSMASRKASVDQGTFMEEEGVIHEDLISRSELSSNSSLGGELSVGQTSLVSSASNPLRKPQELTFEKSGDSIGNSSMDMLPNQTRENN